MRILHYSLGLPPYRTGGMTKFCTDLMQQQIKDGNTVALLWPGRIMLLSGKTRIVDRGRSCQSSKGITNYEIMNPLPVPLDEGIKDVEIYTKDVATKEYSDFLEKFRPDVIHIHTLMGLHRAFLTAAKARGIRLVFSAHDFFPICPKVTLFKNGQICQEALDCRGCSGCNETALSYMKLVLLQSPAYRFFKDTCFIRSIRKRHRYQFLNDPPQKSNYTGTQTSKEYQRLRSYYQSMLDLMDVIHFNSSLTKTVYERYFGDLPGVIIPITHADIADHRKEKRFNENKIRVRYLGPCSRGKGYEILKEAMDKIWSEGKNYCLDIHFTPPELTPCIAVHDRYNYSELEGLFDSTDVLVVPSIWYETFGFTVLEALSYGVPVIITKTVGAKDIVADGAGIVINANEDSLYSTIKQLNVELLHSMNTVILKNQKIQTVQEMATTIYDRCYN